MFGRGKETLREFVRSENSSLRELIRTQHEESKRYREEREKYWEGREKYWEEREEEFRVHQAELHELRKTAEAQAEQTREFNREILLRNEKVYTRVIAEMEEGRKQVQANTRAVLSVLDRLEGSGGAAAA